MASEKAFEPLHQARVVILGAGPTGLGAACRLRELGCSNFTIFEQEDYAGGLAASFTDSNGFTWDTGGHVQFSHYVYFDRMMDALLGDEWLHHERNSSIWIRDVFVPYPFQNNIRHLSEADRLECLIGLIHAARQPSDVPCRNFEDWIVGSFGPGIAKIFLLPYNFKVWAYHPRELSFQWIGDRISKVNLERVVSNLLSGHDDVSWGPNSTFRFPLRGGTGEIWRRLARSFPQEQLRLRKKVVSLDAVKKQVCFADGSSEHYDLLISTIPLDTFVHLSNLDALKETVDRLRHSSIHVVGIGLRGRPSPHIEKRCWMYFPEDSSPFYRATVFSNYSPHNVPDIGKYWSLMVEISESPAKPVCQDQLISSVVSGLLATRLIESKDHIVDVWHRRVEHGYPTPTAGRDAVLNAVRPALEESHIFSRGRFGAWKYEVSNQDHSLMQGVELIDRLLGTGEEETLLKPDFVNSRPKR